MEQLENDFIKSCISMLASEGKEICKEVETRYSADEEFIKSKAYTCCRFIESHCDNPELIKRCQDYMDRVHDYNRYESTFNAIKNEKLDMRNMRIKEL